MKTTINFYPTVDLSTKTLENIFMGKFIPGEPVFIKIHFGEPGNPTAFTPELVQPYVTALHDLGFETVLWDTPVLYESPRASKTGYEKVVAEKGFPSISTCKICDNYEKFKLHDGAVAEVAKLMTDAKNLLVLTHVKGHQMAGFGGAIKNIGIGAVSPRTKGLVHLVSDPLTDEWGFDQDRLGEVVAMALAHAPQNTLFINIIKNVTQGCDCVGEATPIIAPDLGVLAGNNAVAIDQASLDLVNKAAKKEVFLEVNGVNPQSAIDATEKYSGLSKTYAL